MTSEIILELVEMAISLTQTELGEKDVEGTLLDIANKAVTAIQDHTGEPLDPSLIGIEAPL